jgi:hypothetical protein
MINAIKIVFPFKNASRLGFLIATFDYQKVCLCVYNIYIYNIYKRAMVK